MHSIRSRTLALVLGVLGVALGTISWVSYRDAQHEIEELFDARLAQSARLLEGMIGRDMSPAALASLQHTLDQAIGQQGRSAPGHPYESKLAFQVVDRSGTVVLKSASAPADLAAGIRIAPDGDAGTPAAHDRHVGYRNVPIGEHRWRVFVLEDRADDFHIIVGERDDVRGELVGKIALRSLLPDLVGLPLLALVVWLAIGWSLKPLELMAAQIRARDPERLAPFVLSGLPRELEPMIEALNRLLLQLDALLAREKRFLADAAHELRTPLAVLRVHAQNAIDAPDAADRAEALRQMVAGVDRATRLATQLLTLARLEPDAARLHRQPLDLRAFVRSELAELTPLALDRGQELTLATSEDQDFRVTCDATLVGVLLQNLVGNAIQYTPRDGRIEVSLDATAAAVELAVDDSGPGIRPELRDKMFQRFAREGAGTGVGLGLSIAQRIAELHHAAITLGDSPLGGLRVQVSLPRHS